MKQTKRRRLSLNCPNCGKEITIEGIKFCPYCSYELNAVAPTPTHTMKAYKPMRMTAGIMTIIGACLAITAGIFYLIASIASFSYYYGGYSILYLIFGIFAILAFAFGLTAGIFAVRKRRLPFALFGMSWLIASGILASFPLWFFGLPITILAIISVVFIAIARSEFSKPNF